MQVKIIAGTRHKIDETVIAGMRLWDADDC